LFLPSLRLPLASLLTSLSSSTREQIGTLLLHQGETEEVRSCMCGYPEEVVEFLQNECACCWNVGVVLLDGLVDIVCGMGSSRGKKADSSLHGAIVNQDIADSLTIPQIQVLSIASQCLSSVIQRYKAQSARMRSSSATESDGEHKLSSKGELISPSGVSYSVGSPRSPPIIIEYHPAEASDLATWLSVFTPLRDYMFVSLCDEKLMKEAQPSLFSMLDVLPESEFGEWASIFASTARLLFPGGSSSCQEGFVSIVAKVLKEVPSFGKALKAGFSSLESDVLRSAPALAQLLKE
ncbi:hypothetical protein ADUPG1_008678, partial [Aduncisulcus paluster]